MSLSQTFDFDLEDCYYCGSLNQFTLAPEQGPVCLVFLWLSSHTAAIGDYFDRKCVKLLGSVRSK
jgi:hypothetical protein